MFWCYENGDGNLAAAYASVTKASGNAVGNWELAQM